MMPLERPPHAITQTMDVGSLHRESRTAPWRLPSRWLHHGQLAVDLPSGHSLAIEGRRPGLSARLTLRRWRGLWRAIAGGDVGFAEAYIAGDVATPDLDALLRLAARHCAAKPTPKVQPPRLLRQLRHALNRNTLSGSRRNVSAHYDLGNEFYRLWLDADMNYSAALFTSADLTLEAAQAEKLDRVLGLLDLAHGQDVLEIGCGWGALAERIVSHQGCGYTGLTLSARQLAFARERLAQRRLADRADLRLQDYRDVRGPYDRIVSIEMLEAVGAGYWPVYFERLRENLRPGGVAVLQVITIDERRFDAYRRRPDFIQRYIFPGGMLPTVEIMRREITAAGLTLTHQELFGTGYARTLAAWQQRFQAAWPAIARMGFDDRFKRMWEYYLAYCRAGFEAGLVNVGLYRLTRRAD